MKIHQRQTAILVVLLLSGLLALGGCAMPPAESPATPLITNNAGEAIVEPVDVSSGMDTNSPVALVYRPVGDELLLANSMGLLRWTAKEGWMKVSIPETPAGLSGLVIDSAKPSTIYASAPDLGVILSNDAGATWQTINSGLPSLNVTALALNLVRRETLYVWVRDDGIYRTENSGNSWKRVPDRGPADVDVRGLVHSTLPGSMNTGWLYAATPTGAYLSMDCF